MFTFNVRECDGDDFGWERDYDIFVYHPVHDDDVGIHIPEVKEAMEPLSIYGEDMENCFSGFFNEDIKNINDVKNHLESFGWKLDESL